LSQSATSELLAQSLDDCLEYGHWGFRHPSGYPAGHSEQRIVPQQMYSQREDWLKLLADLILEHPADALIGLCELGDELDWCTPLAAILKERGTPQSVSGVTSYGISQSGPGLTALPKGTSVSVFTDVTTTGRELMSFRGLLSSRGLKVDRLLSLVHCGPNLPRGILGIPYAAAVHYPLPLAPATSCFECLLGHPLPPLAS
jgi:hypothetical protein